MDQYNETKRLSAMASVFFFHCDSNFLKLFTLILNFEFE